MKISDYHTPGYIGQQHTKPYHCTYEPRLFELPGKDCFALVTGC